MVEERRERLPHILLRDTAETQRYTPVTGSSQICYSYVIPATRIHEQFYVPDISGRDNNFFTDLPDLVGLAD